jgi:3-deoxy-D-manno-oct-2-ulosonic acid (Kdo) hydroxylase
MLVSYSADALTRLGPHEISDALERGAIVHFPECPLPLPADTELAYLREQLPRQLHVKNVSYHPESDRLHGVKDDAQLRSRACELLRAHSRNVEAFLHATIPTLTAGWTVGTSSFRPIEERGRNLSPHASNELIHVDAGAYGATHGDHILRFFVNVNPALDRVWATKGAFPYLYERYGSEAGIAGAQALGTGPLDQLRRSALHGLVKLGVKEAMIADSSPYDRLMRRFHNYMKDTPAFQTGREDYEQLRFKPYSAWMVFTDVVSHASVAGQHALVNTFIVRLAACRLAHLAPFNILRRGKVDQAAVAP